MTQDIFEDVVMIQNRYREWVQGGRKDEALGDALLRELRKRLTILFRVPGDLTSLKQAKGGSGLELTVLRTDKMTLDTPPFYIE
ncbi:MULTISPECIES: hypothetical protein [Cupriavidus]|uniref:hypothetical protein n=1 Tax=Cupriavidus sp. DF5525 TaxID=3160989 RepID=UPI0003B0749B|nr:hypothetical protein N234_36195 [Ralstonia pickettii DTP0602]